MDRHCMYTERRRLWLPGQKGGVNVVDAEALLGDRERSLLRQLSLLGGERQLRVYRGSTPDGCYEFRPLSGLIWPKNSPAAAADVVKAEHAWRELARMVPGLVVRDNPDDQSGASLAHLYPKVDGKKKPRPGAV